MQSMRSSEERARAQAVAEAQEEMASQHRIALAELQLEYESRLEDQRTRTSRTQAVVSAQEEAHTKSRLELTELQLRYEKQLQALEAQHQAALADRNSSTLSGVQCSFALSCSSGVAVAESLCTCCTTT